MPKHGMQMGKSGYGLTHGYGPDEERDDDNSHEYKGHGVNQEASLQLDQGQGRSPRREDGGKYATVHSSAVKSSGWDRWKEKRGKK